MKDRIEADVTLWAPNDYLTSAAFTCPFSVPEVFGTKARIPVKITVDGHTFRSSLAPMSGQHMMVFNMEMRQKTGYKAGDTIHIILEKDTEPRVIEIPQDVTNVLKTSKTAYDLFMKYSYSHKKEVMDWINEAKKPDTRKRRILKLLDTLKEKPGK
jgi:bifunctional DNA-binding transcriptional regulator/antitoxin component of YhaV-PrlF toxin-antitoxin module